MNSTLLADLHAQADAFIDIRRDIHHHPELAFDEHRTSALVAAKLESWGYAVERGLGGTGLVGRLVRGEGQRRLGLRADMDALADRRNHRPRLREQPCRRDACLRPRRPHGHAAGRRAPSRRARALRRHAEPDLPAGRGRRRRRAADDGRRPVRQVPLRRDLRACTTCRASRRAGWRCAKARRWPRRTTPRSRSPASAATARCRTGRPIPSSPRPAS